MIKRLLALRFDQGLRAKLIRGATGVGGLKLASLVLTFSVSVILARGLGPDQFGQYTFIISVITILSLPLDRSMRQLVTREVARYQNAEQWPLINGLLKWSAYALVFGTLFIWVFLGPTAGYYASWQLNDRWTLLLLALISIPLLGLNGLKNAHLRGLGYVFFAQIPDLLVRPAFHLSLAGLLLTAGLLNAATAITAFALAAGSGAVIGAAFLHTRQPAALSHTHHEHQTKQWLSMWGPFTLLSGMVLLNNQIGILLLGWLGTDEQVAGFRVAERGAQLVSLSLTVINLILAPYIARAHQDAHHSRLRQLSRQSSRMALGVALPIALPLALFSAPLITLVFGAGYTDTAAMPLTILALAQLINVTAGSVGLFLTMTGFERETLLGHLAGLIVNVSASLILIPSYGAQGAAYAAAAGLLTWNTVLAFKVYRRLQLRPGIF